MRWNVKALKYFFIEVGIVATALAALYLLATHFLPRC